MTPSNAADFYQKHQACWGFVRTSLTDSGAQFVGLHDALIQILEARDKGDPHFVIEILDPVSHTLSGNAIDELISHYTTTLS